MTTAHSLEQVARPIRFARRQDFKNLSRLKNFEASLRAILQQLPRQELSADELSKLEAVESLVFGLDQIEDASRQQRLEKILAIIDGSDSIPVVASPSGAAGRKKARSRSKGAEPSARPKVKTGDGRRARGAERSDLDTPLAELAGVGPVTAERLRAKGLVIVQDLLFFFPRRYEPSLGRASIASLEAGKRATVIGSVRLATVRPIGRGRRAFDLVVEDDTGSLSCRFFRFIQRAVEGRYPPGTKVEVSGMVSVFGAKKQMVHPQLRKVDDTSNELSHSAHPAEPAFVPIYPDVEGVPARNLAKLIQRVVRSAAAKVVDPLPEPIRVRRALPDLSSAIRRAHQVVEGSGLAGAGNAGLSEEMRRRLAFDELFHLMLVISLERRGRLEEPGLRHEAATSWREQVSRIFPFELTAGQKKAADEICADLAKPVPMHRLLQGDVGCGKTAVALLAAQVVAQSGRQTALLAPTEVLAEQHFSTVQRFLAPLGMRIALLTGKADKRNREEILRALAGRKLELLVGTHALFEDDVVFGDLGLVIIDEQHRFGVEQRARLLRKRTDEKPDMLVMSATPIPRTLALTVYGDLEVSSIRELPPGRRPIESRVVSIDDLDRVYREVEAILAAGRQAYFIYPLVEPCLSSEALEQSDASCGKMPAETSTGSNEQSAEEAFVELTTRFAPYPVGLLHGRMSGAEKAEVLRAFGSGSIAVLVATTVVEVGVDVPNAAVMVVHSAERFGLAQLHQLRGRVGRGEHEGLCCFVNTSARVEAATRLDALRRTTDGFEIAELDLALRGPGEMTGTRQSGVDDLVFTNLARDGELIEAARDEAKRLLEQDPRLEQPAQQALRQALMKRYAERACFAAVA